MSKHLKMKFGHFTMLAFAAILSTATTSCHNHESHGDHVEKEGAEDEHSHHKPGIVHLSPDDATRFGVEVEQIVPTSFRDAIRVSGEILPSSSDAATASAPTSGVFSLSSGITRGATVKAGQTIGRISAKGMTGGDPNAAAKVAIDNAKRELDRLKPLLDDGLVTRKEYNDALAAYNSALAAYSPSAAHGSVTAPRSGVITDIVANDGQYLEAGAPVALISGTGTVTLRALLPARNSSFLPFISGAIITPHGASETPVDVSDYNGKLLSVASNSAETPGYIPVYFTLSSAAPVVAGSAAEVYLKGAERSGVLSVPVSSLTEQLGENFVYLKLDSEDYEKRPVTIGRSDGKRTEILKGISEGDSVVTAGLSFVRLAEQSTVVPEGHSHNH